MTEYVTFDVVDVSPSGKTSIIEVKSKNTGERLGVIKWYAPWRQYCFYPDYETIWSRGCLEQVRKFIDDLMEKRK